MDSQTERVELWLPKGKGVPVGRVKLGVWD